MMYLAWFLYSLMMFLTLILMLMDKIEVRLVKIDKETGSEIELSEIFRYILILCLSITWPIIPFVNILVNMGKNKKL